MSGQLSEPVGDQAPVRDQGQTGGQTGGQTKGRAEAYRILVLLAAGAALGSVLAVLWELLWQPPSGIVFEHAWFLDEIGITQDISALGWFVVLGAIGGLVYGAVAAKLGDGLELLTLLGVLIGSALAVWVMLRLGHWLGPEDPRVLAASSVDLTALPGDLRLTPTDADQRLLGLHNSAYLVLPGAALIGLVSIFLGQSSRRQSEGEVESVG